MSSEAIPWVTEQDIYQDLQEKKLNIEYDDVFEAKNRENITTSDGLNDEFKEYKKRTSTFTKLDTLDSLLNGKPKVQPSEKVDQCICIAMGHFYYRQIVENKNTSPQKYRIVQFELEQLAYLDAILRTLSKSHKIRHVYFQDPKYTPLEANFLNNLGTSFGGVDSTSTVGDAEKKMTANTLLFAPAVSPEVLSGFLKVVRPALYVGHDLSLLSDYSEVIKDFEKATKSKHLVEGKTYASWENYTVVTWENKTG